jgi:hypothetical protein
MYRWIGQRIAACCYTLGMLMSPILAADVTSTVASVPVAGEITCKPASPGRINCWVARTGTRAVSVSVYEEAGKKMAKLRLYTRPITEPEEYAAVNTKIPVPTGTIPDDKPVVPVELVEVTGKQNTFEMKYEKKIGTTTTDVSIGYLSFSPSANGRISSDVVVRLKGNVKAANQEVFGASVTDPCNQPPDDDIGEEEEIAPGFTPVGETPTSPGRSLALTAPVATAVVQSPSAP